MDSDNNTHNYNYYAYVRACTHTHTHSYEATGGTRKSTHDEASRSPMVRSAVLCNKRRRPLRRVNVADVKSQKQEVTAGLHYSYCILYLFISL